MKFFFSDYQLDTPWMIFYNLIVDSNIFNHYSCIYYLSLFFTGKLNFHSMFELKKLRKTYSNKNIMYEMTFNKSSTPTAAANFIVVMDWPLRKRASSFFWKLNVDFHSVLITIPHPYPKNALKSANLAVFLISIH